MKKITGIAVLFIAVFFIGCCFIKPKPLSLDTCIELGICAEGLELKDNGKPYTMTKEYCIKNHYTWLEKAAACNVRKSTY